ncbi:MAG TPA: Ku protein, partial [Roseiarcus sp.]|nr:Ku protein [Roseiarcus sp.]
LDLAKHIIKTKPGKFDPKAYDDRYEAALAELVKAKLEGRPIEAAKPKPSTNAVDLMDALRRSAAAAGAPAAKASAKKPPARRAGGKRKRAGKTGAAKRQAARKAS